MPPMLSDEERREIGLFLSLHRRGILGPAEVVARLGSVARPHNLDLIEAEIPPDLVEPLRLQMQSYRPVRAVGYWCPLGSAPPAEVSRRPLDAAFPDPRRLVCEGPDLFDRQKVSAYLRAGRTYARWRGLSYCRFGCGRGGDSSMGSRCLTDGNWVWPEGLTHYVEVHSIRLPEELLSEIEAENHRIPDDRPMPDMDTQGEPDYEFWIGWGQSTMMRVDS